MIRIAFITAGMVCLLTGFALAQESVAPADCVAPIAPPRVTIAPPVKPQTQSCMDTKTGVSKCGKAATDKFNAQVDAYNDAMEKSGAAFSQYQAALRQYLTDANQYANCEIERNNKQIN